VNYSSNPCRGASGFATNCLCPLFNVENPPVSHSRPIWPLPAPIFPSPLPGFCGTRSRPADCRRRTARRLRSVFLTSPLVHGSRACAGPKGAAHCGPARQTGYHRRERERIPERRNPVAGLLPSFCSSCHSRSQDYGYRGPHVSVPHFRPPG